MRSSPSLGATFSQHRGAVRAAFIAAAVLIAGCGGSMTDRPETGASAKPSTAAAQAGLVQAMQSRLGGLDRSKWFRTLAEAWPSDQNRATFRGGATEAVVRGSVVAVTAGRAFGPPAADIESPQVDFGAQALWRTLHIDVEIAKVLAGSVGDVQRVTIGLAIDGTADPDLMIEGVMSLGNVVFFLGRSPVFSYDPDLYWIVGDGALTATVPAPGRYELIFLPVDEARPLLGDQVLTRSISS